MGKKAKLSELQIKKTCELDNFKKKITTVQCTSNRRSKLSCIVFFGPMRRKKTPWAGSVRAAAARHRTVRRAIFIER